MHFELDILRWLHFLQFNPMSQHLKLGVHPSIAKATSQCSLVRLHPVLLLSSWLRDSPCLIGLARCVVCTAQTRNSLQLFQACDIVPQQQHVGRSEYVSDQRQRASEKKDSCQ